MSISQKHQMKIKTQYENVEGFNKGSLDTIITELVELVDNLEDLKHEVCCFFLEKLDYFKPERGTKAFSYFSIVGKNYLILYNNNNYKKMKITVPVLAADDDGGVLHQLGRDQRKQDIKDFIDYLTLYIDKHMFTMFKKVKLGLIFFILWSIEVFSKWKNPFSQASVIIKADFGLEVLNNFVLSSSTDNFLFSL